MKTSSIVASDVSGSLRFDSKFHLARDNPLIKCLKRGSWPTVTVGEMFGESTVWTGNIFTRVYASEPSHGKPLLVPYDLFRYVPWSDKILSRTQVPQFERLQITRGWLFLICSGRNLGPVTIADRFCEQFAMSHDMVRVSAALGDDLYYLAAFLSTAHGQALIRTDMNGSVIDHTDAKQVAALRYPLVGGRLQKDCSSLFEEAFLKREEARLELAQATAAYLDHFNLNEFPSSASTTPRRFSVSRSSITDRFDAEPRAPLYAEWRRRISDRGGCQLGAIAEIRKPSGRYKTTYVDDEQFGVRMMNGRQIAQYKPIALKLMNLSGFKDPAQFQIDPGTTLLTADGRAEENLADCVLVTDDRAGWAASGHVHRVVPREGIHPGLVYLGCSSPPVQAQLKALATGSVVDALSEDDVASVAVPYEKSEAATQIGDRAVRSWELFCSASRLEEEAIKRLEEALNRG